MFGVKKINPLDLNPSVAVGVSIPFNAGGVFNSTYTTQNAIKSNLINFFLTNRKERFLNPNFGGDLRKFVFEQITNGNEDLLKDNIQSQIQKYFKNIDVIELNVNKIPNENTINVYFKYGIKDTDNEDEININLD